MLLPIHTQISTAAAVVTHSLRCFVETSINQCGDKSIWRTKYYAIKVNQEGIKKAKVGFHFVAKTIVDQSALVLLKSIYYSSRYLNFHQSKEIIYYQW